MGEKVKVTALVQVEYEADLDFYKEFGVTTALEAGKMDLLDDDGQSIEIILESDMKILEICGEKVNDEPVESG